MSDIRTGVPLTVATMMSLNCSVASTRPSVRRPDLPLALLERAAGDLDVLLLNGVAHLVDRQAVRVQLLDVDDDVDFARPVAAHA